MLKEPGTDWEKNCTVRRVIRGSVLARNCAESISIFQMLRNRQNLRLRVKMLSGCFSVGSRYKTKGVILNDLELVQNGRTTIIFNHISTD